MCIRDRLVLYLDDVLLMAPTRAACAQARDTFLRLLAQFGFMMNFPKSILEPTQTIEFLGILIRSQTMSFGLPLKKVEKTLAQVSMMMVKGAKSQPCLLYTSRAHETDTSLFVGSVRCV